MRQRREMSVRRFEKRHPYLEVRRLIADGGKFFCHVSRKGTRDHYACGKGKTAAEAVYDASERCYRLAGLDAMEKQGWADVNTGQVGVPLERHHKVHRAHGRDDSEANLAGVSRGTHNAQHGQVQPSPRRSAAGPLIEPGR